MNSEIRKADEHIILERLRKQCVLFQFIRPDRQEGPWHSCKDKEDVMMTQTSAIVDERA